MLGTLRHLGLDAVLSARGCRQRGIIISLIVSRIIDPTSKLAACRRLKPETAADSLHLQLDLAGLHERELYEAMDWLLKRQRRIENKLARKHLAGKHLARKHLTRKHLTRKHLTRKHLAGGALVLYDVSGSYYTGRCGGLVSFGHNRDGKRGCPQIVYGLLCNAEGCPVSIEVFEGKSGDPAAFSRQVHKVRTRFGIERVIFVGDRGMITSRRIEQDLRPVEGLDWITALRSEGLRALMSAKIIDRSLFDQQDLAEVTSPDYPNERLIVCRNPLLADERARKRSELLACTQQKLDPIVAATLRTKNPLRGKDKIALRVGKVLGKYKVGKHFLLDIGDGHFRYRRDEVKIAEEAAMDGFYCIRTSVPKQTMSSDSAVRAYKSLSQVERAFRCMKTIDLRVRPIFHRLDDRIRAHVFLCMLAYYVEWHLRRKLAAILFDDHERQAAERTRESIVSPAPRSAAAKKKDQSKRTAGKGQSSRTEADKSKEHTKRTHDDLPVHSLRTLLSDLATLARNRVRIEGTSEEFYLTTRATPFQAHVFDLLGVQPGT